MRKIAVAFVTAVVFCACDPTIKKFKVEPATLQCPGNVTVTWQGDGNGGHLEADQAVTPPMPGIVVAQGSLVTKVSKTTTFSYSFPSAAHREVTVTVANQNCGGGPGPGGSCGPQTLTFHGTCVSAQSGPSYDTQNVTAALAPGNLVNLTSDADFPVHVQHAGQDIALGAGGGPILALPAVLAAGDYTITVPGQVGQMVCAGAGPTQGTTDAPVVHITVTPTCK